MRHSIVGLSVPLVLVLLAASCGRSEEPDGRSRKRGQWAVEGAYVTTEHKGRDISRRYSEPLASGTFSLKVREGHRLVVVGFKLTARVADPDAVKRLADRRDELAEEFTGQHGEHADANEAFPLDEDVREKLTGEYRAFDMAELRLIDGDGGKHEPHWIIDAPGDAFQTVDGITFRTEATRDYSPWHAAVRSNRGFAGLLEADKPVDMAFVFIVPGEASLDDMKLALGHEKPVALEHRGPASAPAAQAEQAPAVRVAVPDAQAQKPPSAPTPRPGKPSAPHAAEDELRLQPAPPRGPSERKAP